MSVFLQLAMKHQKEMEQLEKNQREQLEKLEKFNEQVCRKKKKTCGSDLCLPLFLPFVTAPVHVLHVCSLYFLLI